MRKRVSPSSQLTSGRFRHVAIITIGFWTSALPLIANDQSFSPVVGGTIVDGGTFGAFDGVADAGDWTFNGSSNEGAITVSRDSIPGLESRVVFEFDLTTLTPATAHSAIMRFQLRGSTRFPADPTIIDLVAYPGDLRTSLGDFSAGPASEIEQVVVNALQPSSTYQVDLSDLVADFLAHGTKTLGVRFQVAANSSPGQAFMDALDTDPMSKPSLTVSTQAAGDYNGDGHITPADFAHLPGCLSGPRNPAIPNCLVFDFDHDLDVDLKDVKAFELALAN